MTMKQFCLLLTSICVLSVVACKSKQQSDAEKLMGDIQSTIKKNSPGFITTSKEGYWMKATIGGKEWTASAMLPNDNSDSRRIQGENNGEAIGFYIWMRGLENGKRFAFSETRAADLFTNDTDGIWGGRKGEIVITKIDTSSMEGSFSFTASNNSGKTIEVKDGSFHIPLTPGTP